MGTVLVAYASKHGSTAEIATAIGQKLGERGHIVEVRSAGDVRDVRNYDAVVVGSAVYMSHWQKDGLNLLKRYERDLRERQTWLFSSGPTGGSEKSDPVLAEARTSVTAVSPIKEVADRGERIGARGHATFPGKVGEEATGLLERWMPRGDWRDFDAIRKWADGISEELTTL
jgi:menaquinone-dependent protoporphyrinogen oxidase